jgi:hypothetical protein
MQRLLPGETFVTKLQSPNRGKLGKELDVIIGHLKL